MPIKPDSWMPWYIGKYLADTTHLSRGEHGSYLMMLAHAWMHGGILPADDDQLARIARCTPAEWARSRDTLLAFWTLTEGAYTQGRLLRELAKARSNLEQRIEAGKASAKVRWGKAKNPDNGNGFNDDPVTDAITSVTTSVVTKGVTERQRNDTPITCIALSAPLIEPPAPSVPIQNPQTLDAALTGKRAPRAASARKVNGSANPKSEERPAKSAACWLAYSGAYQARYGTAPVRNSKANALLCQLVDRLGTEEAPAVAAWYVSHNQAWYVQHGHALDSLVRDAETLRTQWATGRSMTVGQARQADRIQGQGDIWREIINEERAKNAN